MRRDSYCERSLLVIASFAEIDLYRCSILAPVCGEESETDKLKTKYYDMAGCYTNSDGNHNEAWIRSASPLFATGANSCGETCKVDGYDGAENAAHRFFSVFRYLRPIVRRTKQFLWPHRAFFFSSISLSFHLPRAVITLSKRLSLFYTLMNEKWLHVISMKHSIYNGVWRAGKREREKANADIRMRIEMERKG